MNFTEIKPHPTSKEFISVKEQNDIFKDYVKKPFSSKNFPILFQQLADEQLKGRNVPLEFTCFSALGIIAGLAGTNYKLTNAVSNHNQYANLYLLGSGESSTGKSTALDPLLDYLMQQHNLRVALYEKELREKSKKNGNDANDESSPFFIFSNGTAEGIRNKMQDTQAPIFSPNDEANDNLKIMTGMYKKNNADELSFYNKAWDGKAYNAVRATGTHTTIFINKACLSLLWLTQSYSIRNSLFSNDTSKDSGFLARVIFFKANHKLEKLSQNPPIINEEYFKQWEAIIDELLDIRYNRDEKDIYATKEAKEIFFNFYNEMVDIINNNLPECETLLAKSQEKACRVALCFAIAEGATTIDEQTAKNACEVIRYSNSVLLEMFSAGYDAQIERLKSEVDEFLKKRQIDRLSISDFKRSKRIELSQLQSLCNNYPKQYYIEENAIGKGQVFIKITNSLVN